MNNQLSTIDQARLIVETINAQPNPIGGGVLPEDSSNNYINDKSGIYLEIWVDAGNQPQPGLGAARPYLLRFQSGYGGNNVGLIIAQALAHNSVDYALGELRKSADEWLKLQG